MEYIITTTEAEKIAMEYIAADVKEWIENATKARAFIAMKEIQSKLVDHCNNNEIALAIGLDAQISQAKELGILQKQEVTQQV